MNQPNLLNLIINYHSEHGLKVQKGNDGNSIQIIGTGFEEFVRELFKKGSKKEPYFAYQQNGSNPPDILLLGKNKGDAVEIKRHEKFGSLEFNSSLPRNFFYRNDPMITKECKDSESGKWKKRDMLYVIGINSVKSKTVNSLSCFYGDLVFKDVKFYRNIFNNVKGAVKDKVDIMNNLGVEMEISKELGRLKLNDGSKSFLRIRAMYQTHPEAKLMELIKDYNPKENKFNCVMREKKYLSFEENLRKKISDLAKKKVLFKSSVKLPDPNNDSKMIDCILIKS